MKNYITNFKRFLLAFIALSFIGGAVIAGAYGMKAFDNIRQGMKVEAEETNLKLLEQVRVDLEIEIVSEKAKEFKRTNEISEAEKALRDLTEGFADIVKRRIAISTDIEKNICDQAVSRAQIERLNGKTIPQGIFKIVKKFDCGKRFENIPDWLQAETVPEKAKVVTYVASGDFTPTASWVSDLRTEFDEHLAGFDNEEVWTD